MDSIVCAPGCYAHCHWRKVEPVCQVDNGVFGKVRQLSQLISTGEHVVLQLIFPALAKEVLRVRVVPHRHLGNNSGPNFCLAPNTVLPVIVC